MCQITRKYNPEYTNIKNEMLRIYNRNKISQKQSKMLNILNKL